MNTIAVVDAGNHSRGFYEKYFADILRISGAEKLLVITDGDVTREGRLAAADKYDRAAMFRAAGAAAVVEVPLCGMLLGENVFAFAITCMLQKLPCAQQIAIPYAGGDAALFERITSFLFDQPAAYQQQMRALRSAGKELRRELPGVLEKFVPGAQAFLSRGINHLAVEMYNSLRLAYFPAKPVLVPVDGEDCEPLSQAQDGFLLARVKQIFLTQPEADALKWAQSMYFGSEWIDRRLLETLQGDAAGYDELSRRAELPGAHAVHVRWHLMACLTGYRKVDSFVCIIYNYIPYIRLLDAADAQFRAQLEATVGTNLLVDTPDETDYSRLTDPAKELLNQIDRRARELFLVAE